MKRVIIPLMLVLFFQVSKVRGQEIEAKYNGKKIKIVKKGIKKGETFKINLKGINTILHKPVFKFEDFELVSKTPSGLATILPNFPESFSLERMVKVDKSEEVKFLDATKFFIEESTILYETKMHLIKDDGSIKPKGLIKAICQKNRTDWIKVLNAKFSDETVDKSNYIAFTTIKIATLLNFYEILEETSKNSNQVDIELVKILSYNRPYYLKLKGVQSKIISSLSAIEEGANDNIESEKESAAHFPEKWLTNVEIYLVNRFNPADTLAITKTDLFVKGKFKIDFSTGPSVNTLVQNEYFFTKTDTANSGVDLEKASKLDLGIAALMHLDWKVSSSFAIGPAIGASISIIDEKPRYIIGLGGTIGKEKSFSIVAGANSGQVKVLSKQISSNGNDYDGTSDLSQFENVPLASKIKWGFFFGVTYNLTRTRK